MPWPRRSMAFIRLRSSDGGDPGDHSKPLNTPRSNGESASTTSACSRPSAISRPPKPEEQYYAMLDDMPMAA